MVKCSLVPFSNGKRRDLATPRHQLVTNTTASRLRKRKSRGGAHRLLDFPWNPASRAVVAGVEYARRRCEKGRRGCSVCHASSNRHCICGAKLAEKMSRQQLSSFVVFVRAPTTPVYTEGEPVGMQQFRSAAITSVAGAPTKRLLIRTLLRFATVAALSGSPDTIASLSSYFDHAQSDAALLHAITMLLKAGDPFFRHNQNQGRRIIDIVTAFRAF